jgi:hypothetical protein
MHDSQGGKGSDRDQEEKIDPAEISQSNQEPSDGESGEGELGISNQPFPPLEPGARGQPRFPARRVFHVRICHIGCVLLAELQITSLRF